MHTFYTIRYPPPASQKSLEDDQPIRVTNKAMESLLFCIVHSVEFQCPLQPIQSHNSSSEGGSSSKIDDIYVHPVENSSTLLGNVTYVARSKHSPSVLVSLRTAVEAACAIPIPENSNQVHFELQVRIMRRQRGWLWSESRPLVEWVFLMIKTREEFSFSTAQCDTSERVPPRQSTHVASSRRIAGNGGGSSGSSSGGGLNRAHEDRIVYSNDPEQIRRVLQFILKNSYEAIDLNTYSDFRCGELVFDISVQEVK